MELDSLNIIDAKIKINIHPKINFLSSSIDKTEIIKDRQGTTVIIITNLHRSQRPSTRCEVESPFRNLEADGSASLTCHDNCISLWPGRRSTRELIGGDGAGRSGRIDRTGLGSREARNRDVTASGGLIGPTDRRFRLRNFRATSAEEEARLFRSSLRLQLLFEYKNYNRLLCSK